MRSLAYAAGGLVLCASVSAQDGGAGERHPFGLAEIRTANGRPVPIEDFFLSQDCALCHYRQWQEMNGSMHSVAHTDPLYRRFAELAREEAGEEVYTYCSSCHSPAGVVSGLIPGTPEENLPAEAKAGVTCDVCHQISAEHGATGRWGEPGNASFTLNPGREKYGILGDIARNPAHTGVRNELFETSEFCAACHTVIHPQGGLRIEHTYEEWKNSIYAEKGIQCQDCHMRSVEDAIQVAQTLTPTVVRGFSSRKGGEREIHPHLFVGGNANTEVLSGSRRHGKMAEQRLQSAALLEIEAPSVLATPGQLKFDLAVTNIGAGHNLPTSLTELREMWLHVRVLAADEVVLHESGHLDEAGEITAGAIRFGSSLVDAEGNHTYKPWEAVAFDWKRLIGPKQREVETVEVELPTGMSGTVIIEARLLYRSAPPHVIAEVMQEEAFVPKVVEMASARAQVSVDGSGP